MGSALLNTTADLEFAELVSSDDVFSSGVPLPKQDDSRLERAAKAPAAADELRTQVAERLAAHRSRRGAAQTQAAAEPARPAAATGRSAQIAAAVAERYAHTPSYRQVLAAEAERAIQQARAAAEVAALNAQAIAAAQQRLLDAYDERTQRQRLAESEEQITAATGADAGHEDIGCTRAVRVTMAATEQELWPELAECEERVEAAPAITNLRDPARRTPGRDHSAAASSSAGGAPAGLTVRLYDGAAAVRAPSARTDAMAGRGHGEARRGFGRDNYEAEAMALDDEIAFRQAPVFEEPAGPPVALPANLIEFPRQLVAARKARPRYAEGPLREEAEAAAGDGQLRIFEVDPAQISTSPAAVETAQWTSIWLDAPAQAFASNEAGDEAAGTQFDQSLGGLSERAIPEPQPASLVRRGVAGAINLAIVGCGLLAFAGVFAAVAGTGIRWHADLASLRVDVAAVLAQTGLQPRGVAMIATVGSAFLLLVYHAMFFWFSTATPGMRCVRIALCTFEDESPTRRSVRRRMAATLLSACSLGMGYAWAALDEQRMTWHDRMTGMYLRRY